MYVLVWCIICTGLGVLNWTGVMYILDWGLEYVLLYVQYSTGVLYEGMEGGEALPLHLY